MYMKKILIINANPVKDSLCTALAEAYEKGATGAGASCKMIFLADLKFDPVMRYGYKKRMEMEPDLIAVQQDILDADHLVFVYPNWWATYPALLKGFFDRTFVPGFAFRYRDNSPMWDKLLVGKTARLLVTMDTPRWFYRLFYKNAGHHTIKFGILEFSGIKPVKIRSFSPVKSSSAEQRNKWLKQAEEIGSHFF